MVDPARPPTRRRGARSAVLAPLAALAVLVPFAPPSSAEDDGGPPPPLVAEAYDGEQRLSTVREVTELCAQGAACHFRMYDRIPREYLSAVMSLGNAAINCTDEDMEIDRTVTFVTSSTDNINGEISGSATVEGAIDGTVSASAAASVAPGMVNSVNQWGPNKDKGPTTEDQAKNTVELPVTVSGSNALHLGVKATFQLAFKAAYSRTWQSVSTESTRVVFNVSPGDEIQFGVLNAMVRTAGELTVDGTGKLVKNITVDGPSTANVSAVVAQTFTSPDKCLALRPKGRAATEPAGLIELTPQQAGQRPGALYVRTGQGDWRKR
ncbi:hypothetical protein ACIRBX_04625 [Kitasatospora sp. NPDC096147]|uniref:hypothetical protein n=1 Tax=Kitasatospora sp. NPDC096147 TaxID=3364093 RepID=UPI0038274114